MGFFPALFLVLLALQLAGFITVSWWIVFSPLIFVGILIVFVFGLAVWLDR